MVQFASTLGLWFLLNTSNRRLWIPIGQEVLLSMYFMRMLKLQDSVDADFDECLFDVIYFGGLSFSFFGMVFEIVDKKKKDWIPENAW